MNAFQRREESLRIATSFVLLEIAGFSDFFLPAFAFVGAQFARFHIAVFARIKLLANVGSFIEPTVSRFVVVVAVLVCL